MVIAEELVQEINGLVGDIPLVLRGDETSPRFPLVPAEPNTLRDCASPEIFYSPSQDLIVLCIKFDIIFFKVCV